MLLRSSRAVVVGVLLLLAAAAVLAAPKNVILMIGDGMGPDVVTAAGAYRFGTAYHRFGGTQRLALEGLEQHLYVTTYSGEGKGYDFAWRGGDREYPKTHATDSAAAATALATGVKTYNSAIGVDEFRRPLRSITEIARERGMKTGVISSVPFPHATPAAFAAHVADRDNYRAIAHDMLFEVQPDVVMGAGHPESAPAGKADQYISKADWEALRDGKTPYTLIQDREQFRSIPPPHWVGRKIAGLFRNHNCLKYCNADRAAADPALPTLTEMAVYSLGALDNPRGFFLMIEGGAIDWCNHANDLTGAIGETLAFDETVERVLEWIAHHGGWEENLLIITADHDTGYLHDVKPAAAGTLPTVAWGTEGKGWKNHTNRLVDVFFQGCGSYALSSRARPAQDFERGAIEYVDNTDIFRAMHAALLARVGTYTPVMEKR